MTFGVGRWKFRLETRLRILLSQQLSDSHEQYVMPKGGRTCFSSSAPPITLTSVFFLFVGEATAFLGGGFFCLDSSMSPPGPTCGIRKMFWSDESLCLCRVKTHSNDQI